MRGWLLLVAGLAVAPQAFAQSVVDHYRSLVAQTRDDSAYTLTQTASGWRAKGTEEFANVRVVVDIANGFISLNDEGTGGGNVVTEIALFKPAAGGPILGHAQRYHDGSSAMAGKARFFQLTANRWQDLPMASLPPLMPPLFVATRANPPVPYDGELRPVVVHLPRTGTTVDVYLTPSGYGDNCTNRNWLGTEDPVKGCKELADAPNHVELAFDKQRGVFTIARRDRKAPPQIQ